jgi:hypothetical protein
MRAHSEKSGVPVKSRKMPAIILDSRTDALPPEDMEHFKREVNQLIGQYNSLDDSLETDKVNLKKIVLDKIQVKIKEINDKYPDAMINKSPDFRKAIHKELFEEMRDQYKILQINSLLTFEQQKNASPLSEIIANMSPDKANELLDVLIISKGNNLAANLGKLYPQSDESSEAKAFRTFLSKHEIIFLGGSNSKNFSVKPKDGSSEFVLKVENNLSTAPKRVVTHLREKLDKHFAPVHAERLATHGDKTRTILVTDVCKKGNLEEYGEGLRDDDELTFGLSVGKVFEQMAGIMLGIQNAGCIFSDSKITNWLVDNKGQLQISDIKSFVFTDNKGGYNQHTPLSITGNMYCKMITTEGCTPPEYFTGPSVNADSFHAYILGINLYEYATNRPLSPDHAHNGAGFTFKDPFFQTANGVKIQALIKGLVKEIPTERMHIREALDRLFIINNPEFEAVFSAIKNNKSQFHATEIEINEFTLKLQEEINKATSSDKTVILNTLKESIAIFTTLNKLSPNDEKLIEYIREKREEIKKSDPSKGKSIIEALKATADKLSEAEPIFAKLNSLKIGDNDEKMNTFIREKQLQFNNATPDERVKILTELKETVAALSTFQATITKLNSLKIGDNDEEMNSFIREKQLQINNATPEVRVKFVTELNETEAALRNYRITIIDLKKLMIGYNDEQMDTFSREKQLQFIKATPDERAKILTELKETVAVFPTFQATITELNKLNIGDDDEKMNTYIREKELQFLKANPDERAKIVTELNAALTAPKAFKAAIVELNKLKFGANDVIMKTFISAKEAQFSKATPEERVGLITDLNAQVTALNADDAVMNIKKTIETFRKNDKNLFSKGMKEKADRIETAMSHVSIDDRCNFLRSGSTIEVEKALASHRRGEPGKVHLTDTQEIDTTKAARSFTDFKKKYKAQMSPSKDSNKEKSADVAQAAEPEDGSGLKCR